MAAPMSQKTWETLRDAFVAGMVAQDAARVAGVSKSSAKRAWSNGVGGRPPIKDMVAGAQSAVAAAAGEAVREVAARHLATLPLDDNVKAEVGAAIEKEFVRAAEAATLKAAHTASARVMKAWRALAGVVEGFMPEVVEKLRKEFADGKLDARDVVVLLDKLTSIGSKAMSLFGSQQDALRTHIADLGKLEEPIATRTKADAAEAVQRAERGVARARRRGIAVALEVIQGGAADP